MCVSVSVIEFVYHRALLVTLVSFVSSSLPPSQLCDTQDEVNQTLAGGALDSSMSTLCSPFLQIFMDFLNVIVNNR